MIDRLVFPGLRALGWVAVVYAAMLIGPEIEGRFHPVLRDVQFTSTVRQGNDLLVAGTLSKARSCTYIPHWRAKVVNSGRMLQVLIPESDTPNWPKAEVIEFAPFLIVGAGRERVELWAEHDCHPLWNTMSYLGEVQAR